jgi:plasmid stabilization system protein ParE
VARLIIRPPAEADIDAAAAWYERERRGLGNRFLQQLNRTLAGVRERPLFYPRVHDEMRRAILEGFPYGVFFIVVDETISVLAVAHLHRHPDFWERRLID